ncbi:MAG: serine/threonine-protein kinase, partial [Planctomycetota bacterium]
MPPPDAHPGDVLGGYELREKLGEGGMGAVYKATQLSLERDVALKILSPRLSGSPALVGRFMREAYAAGQLVHHNVVQIHDFGKHRPKGAAGGDLHYFSMEFVDGGSLADAVEKAGRLDAKEAVGHVLQAARGLQFAHEHGLIHRDVKPDNLMLNKHGLVKVADLGLVKKLGGEEPGDAPAKKDGDATRVPGVEPRSTSTGHLSRAASQHLTQASSMMGTPAYMPPEQADDAATADHRADIYSLGCTLYFLLVGKPPFSGKTLQETLDGHRRKPLAFPDPDFEDGPKLSSKLRALIEKMCAKDPMDRPRTMARVVADLERYLETRHDTTGKPAKQQTDTLAFAAGGFASSNWAKMPKLVLLGFLVVVLGGVAVTTAAIEDKVLAFGVVGGLLGFGGLAVLLTVL